MIDGDTFCYRCIVAAIDGDDGRVYQAFRPMDQFSDDALIDLRDCRGVCEAGRYS